jgi:putative aldouronate transport system permease protein
MVTMGKRLSMKQNKDFGEIAFVAICYGIVIFVCIVTLYPFMYLLSASLSSSTSVMKNDVVLFPKEFTLRAYQVVMKYKGIWLAYFNTIFYTVFGTLISLGLSILAAYPLSKNAGLSIRQWACLWYLLCGLAAV